MRYVTCVIIKIAFPGSRGYLRGYPIYSYIAAIVWETIVLPIIFSDVVFAHHERCGMWRWPRCVLTQTQCLVFMALTAEGILSDFVLTPAELAKDTFMVAHHVGSAVSLIVIMLSHPNSKKYSTLYVAAMTTSNVVVLILGLIGSVKLRVPWALKIFCLASCLSLIGYRQRTVYVLVRESDRSATPDGDNVEFRRHL